ncbi:DUF2975 domain-containing protein [Actinoplanes derwentensis]|uniref:DUF2975 domain-containing protein n=1 Tax=Actinoplanes derwentensis TaxID=113562 RepID=A0A1H2B9F7_9ACTN|nr:DUF2975 domain-containing protein [Actinoplanes derwentensis]GID86476.1 hypothetical protein Ade03nite_54000 [Actinoplanes derwentensis]SDT54851.1 Protein of unknown function [Actinoplanes derwentensis]
MHRTLVTVLQGFLSFVLLVGVWAQIVLIPTMAADEVELFPPYEPLRIPLVTAAVAFVACVQAWLVGSILLLHRSAEGTLFEQSAQRWVTVLLAAAGGAAVVTFALLVFVTFSEIPSPADGMEVIGLWMGSAVAVAGSVALLMLTLIGRHLLGKAIELRSELDEVV